MDGEERILEKCYEQVFQSSFVPLQSLASNNGTENENIHIC